jgi:hypothetical protein
MQAASVPFFSIASVTVKDEPISEQARIVIANLPVCVAH